MDRPERGIIGWEYLPPFSRGLLLMEWICYKSRLPGKVKVFICYLLFRNGAESMKVWLFMIRIQIMHVTHEEMQLIFFQKRKIDLPLKKILFSNSADINMHLSFYRLLTSQQADHTIKWICNLVWVCCSETILEGVKTWSYQTNLVDHKILWTDVSWGIN